MAGRIALLWGGATDVGRVRTNNQDDYVARPELGLWAVADGMGGHRGGEVASRIACDTLARSYSEQTVNGLVEAIDEANAAVFRAGIDDPDLSGMGTTMVALALIDEPGGELLAVCNVGDSRIYRYSATDLEQLTEDHSLVADMVREGSLTPEEAAVHPQRNVVTRVLGPYEQVPVDVITVEPRHGDRFLLCSDGLFGEVTDPAIAAVLRRHADPNDAASELIRLALEGGGRDNITVVIVDVVDDGGQRLAASAALADTELGTTAAQPALDDVDAVDASSNDHDGRRGRRSRARSRDEDEPRHKAPKARRVTWRVVAFVVLLVALMGGVVATIQWYGGSIYFVGYADDRVSIFKGRPGGVLWIDPELVESTDLDRDQVPLEFAADIDAGKEQPTLGDARAYVGRVTDRADQLAPASATTTAPRRPTTSTTPRGGSTTTTTTAPGR